MKIRSTFIGLVATQIIAAGAIPIFDVLPEFLRAPAAVTESLRLDAGSTGAGEGWLARWLAFGGEGEVTIKLPNNTLTLPHRSASFPTYLPHYLTLPIHGRLVDITSLHPNTSSSSPAIGSPSQACPTSPSLPRWYPPKPPYTIALIERGACDFASKVLYAQSLGAAGVVVGDNKAYAGETDEEGRERRGLLTMFSPAGETEDVRVPSVFVSRASWLLLRDLLRDGVGSEPWSVQEGEWERERDNGDEGGKQGQVEGDEEGGGGMNGKATLWIQLGEAKNEGGTLGNLLSFSLLMPTCFLIITIAANRARAARQRQLDRAPPEIVLALPERVWQPDIVWEKSSSSSSGSSGSSARGGRGSGGGGGGGGGGGSGSGSGLAASRSKYSSSPGPAGSSGSSRTSPSPSSRLHISSTAPLSAGFGGPGGYEQGHGHGEGLEAVLPNLASAGTGTGTNKQVGRSRSSTMMSSMTNTTAQSMYTAQTSHTFPAVHSDTSTPMPTPTQRSAASASTVHPRDRSRSSSPVTSTSTHGTYGTHDVQPSGSAAESSRRLSVSRSQGRLRENSAPLSGRYDHRTHANAHTRYPSVESHSPSRLPAIPASTMPHRSQQVQPQAQPQPHVNKRYYAQDECAICMDDFQPGQIVRILPCGHVFHKDECDEWLMKWRKLCPTCRADVTLPARAMAGSTITPVLLRDAQGNETLTAEPAAMGMGMDEDDIERQQWTTPLAPLRVFGRAVRERGGAIWGWMRGTRGRGEGERERLVPRPNEDEI